MTRIRRFASALALASSGLGMVAARQAQAFDFYTLLGISTSRSVSVEAGDLLGEWKDEDWRRPVWRIARGVRAGEFLASHIRKDGSEQSFRGLLIHAKGQNDILDLTPATNATPDQSSTHSLYKLAMTRVDGLSIGTPRRVRKAFDGHLAKSYNTLKLIPIKPARLRELLETDPRVLSGGIVEGISKDLLVIANPAQVTGFLDKYAEDSSLWSEPKDGLTVVQRRLDEND